MTTFRSSAAALCALLCSVATNAAPAARETSVQTQLEDCSRLARGGPIDEYQCVSRNIERKERLLGDAFSRARFYLQQHEDDGMKDNRRSPIYLDWSQAAWKQYVEHNCTVIAGATGGSNAWVSRFWADCYSQELDSRIKFLEGIAAGQISAQ
jgi:uncharacterized protein YecT (DUF1311 family)